MKMIAVVSCISALAMAATMVGAQRAHSRPEQTHFSAEDEEVNVPVKIPDDVWAILKADEYVLTVMENEDPKLDQVPSSWFSASIIHLQSSNQDDLIVEAEGELRGANVNNFWVFLRRPSGTSLVVNGPAHDLIVRRTRWHGYRIIELDSITCCRLDTTWLRLENGRYRDYRHVSRDL